MGWIIININPTLPACLLTINGPKVICNYLKSSNVSCTTLTTVFF
jgi:hypothetical protein